MRITARRIVAWLLALAITAGIAALSRVPYAAESTGEALVRLSWRARGERVQECRPLTEEERRSLPSHMQRGEVCEGRISPYELTLVLDGERIIQDTIHGRGVREDRPLYVNRDLHVGPGPHGLRLSFSWIGEGRGTQPHPQAIPRELQLDTVLTAAPGEILLVTYSPETRQFVVLGPRD